MQMVYWMNTGQIKNKKDSYGEKEERDSKA